MHANDFVAFIRDMAESTRHLDKAIPQFEAMLASAKAAQAAGKTLIAHFTPDNAPIITHFQGGHDMDQRTADQISGDLEKLAAAQDGQP